MWLEGQHELVWQDGSDRGRLTCERPVCTKCKENKGCGLRICLFPSHEKNIFFCPSLYSFVLIHVEIQPLALRHSQKTWWKYCTRSHSHELEEMENDHFFPWQTKHSSGEQRAREWLCFSPRKFRIFCQNFHSGRPRVC